MGWRGWRAVGHRRRVARGSGEASLAVAARAGVQVVPQTAGAIDELPTLLCAQTRGLCWCQVADWRDWCGCRARKRVDCATTVVSESPQPNVVACASVRIVLVALGTCALGAAVAVRASVRIVLVPSGRLAELVRLSCAQARGLCLSADDVAELARRLLYAQTRGLRCSHGAPVPPVLRLPCAQARGLRWQLATNSAQHTALLCAQARVALFGVDGRGRCLSCYAHIVKPASTPSASPYATSRG